MSEYEAVWSVEIRKRMPAGHSLFGEDTITGNGRTPAEALEHAQALFCQRAADAKKASEALVAAGELLAREPA